MPEDESDLKYSGLSPRDKSMLETSVNSDLPQHEQPEEEPAEQLGHDHALMIEFDDGSTAEIPYHEKVVRFDRTLVEKTAGVEGYIRKSVEWSQLIPILEGILPSTDLINFAENIPESGDAQFQLDHTGETVYTQENMHLVTLFINRMTRMPGFKEQALKISQLFQTVLDKLAPGFITNCYVHKMNLHIHNRDEFPVDKFKSKLLTQRIAEPDVISRGKNMDLNTSLRSSIGLNYQIRELSSDRQALGSGSPERVAELIGFEYDENDPDGFLNSVTDHGFYLQSVDLSIMDGGIWAGANYRTTDAKEIFKHSYPTFAFSTRNSAFIRCLKAFLKNTSSKRYARDEREWADYLTEFDPEIDQGSDTQYSEEHPLIPTILAHPNIPELRWCHATYAYIPTSKNLNICEMISSELPDDRGEEN